MSCAAYTTKHIEDHSRRWSGLVCCKASGASQAFRWRDQTIKDQRSIASRLPGSESNCTEKALS